MFRRTTLLECWWMWRILLDCGYCSKECTGDWAMARRTKNKKFGFLEQVGEKFLNTSGCIKKKNNNRGQSRPYRRRNKKNSKDRARHVHGRKTWTPYMLQFRWNRLNVWRLTFTYMVPSDQRRAANIGISNTKLRITAVIAVNGLGQFAPLMFIIKHSQSSEAKTWSNKNESYQWAFQEGRIQTWGRLGERHMGKITDCKRRDRVT